MLFLVLQAETHAYKVVCALLLLTGDNGIAFAKSVSNQSVQAVCEDYGTTGECRRTGSSTISIAYHTSIVYCILQALSATIQCLHI